MEMDSGEDNDDDTHLCLKCHLTVTGLENYISHCKIWCTKRKLSSKSECAPTPDVPPLSRPKDDHDPALEADDFFSSLELQSSTKRAVASAPTASSKGAAGVLTRSKATAVIKTRDLQTKQEQVIQREAATEDLQVIEEILKSSNSTAPSRRLESTSTQPAETDDDDSDLEILDDADAPPRTHTGGKWRPGGHRSSPPSWSRQSSLGQVEDVQCCPWSMLTLPVEMHATPPPSHTGGKWKPQTSVHSVVSINPLQGTMHHFEDDDDDALHDAPPPGHTSGKWAPGREGAGHADDDLLLLSPQKASASTIQYWCGPCNRRLSSKHLYDKHVKSGLHAKRTFQERELDEDLEAGASHAKDGNVEIAQNRASGKRAIRKPDVYANSDGNQRNKRKRVDAGKKIVENAKKKRRKRKEYVVCEVCKANVCVSMMGKHLASYYHRRKVKRNDPVNEKLLLANIHSVVRQSPFQCSPCKFFCNTMATFKQHWCSQLHIENDAKTSGRYWCSICKCVCETSSDMLEHFESEDHKELILSTNQSVPIVIRKPQIISCWTCEEEFQYNAQLRRHCLKTLHPDFNSVDEQSHFCTLCKFRANSRTSVQRHMNKVHKESAVYFCSLCSLNFASSDEAIAHRRTPEHKYKSLADQKAKGCLRKDVSKLCQHCGSNFQNVLELKTHLRLEHPDFAYRCPHCGRLFALPQELSRHVRDKGCAFFTHPLKSNRVTTGTITSESPPTIPNKLESTTLKCSKCPYVAESKADSIFHEILHGKPVYLAASFEELKELEDGNSGQIMPKYRCSLCSRLYRKSTLLSHIHTHIGDQPYVCGHCDKFFFYRSSLKTHMKRAHSAHAEQKRQALRAKEYKDFAPNRKKLVDSRVYICELCGKSFGHKHNLGEHMKVHTGKEFKCDRADCIFRARSRGELVNHMSIHSDDRPYPCQSCSYAAKTKQQLKRHLTVHEEVKNQSCPHCPFVTRLKSNLQRHLRLHSDAKPFRCPYCQFTCNIFENMRKHVLTTSKHSGKKMYECKFCISGSSSSTEPTIYETNLAKEFKVHLVNEHSTEFKNSSEASAYLSSIYGAQIEAEGVDGTQSSAADNAPKIVQPRKSSKSITKKETLNPNTLAEHNDTSAASEEPTEILSIGEEIYDISGDFHVLHQEIAETEEIDAGPSNLIAAEGNPFLSGGHVFHHRLLDDIESGGMGGQIIVLQEEEIDVETVQASDDEQLF